VHGTGVYSARVGPKGPALERFLDIKKKKNCTKSPIQHNTSPRDDDDDEDNNKYDIN
jgi:hypothetical protein